MFLGGLQYVVFAFLVNAVEASAPHSLLSTLVWVYYTCNSLSGAVYFLTIMLACLADLTPPGPTRAILFGVLMATAMAGISCTPIISVLLFKSDGALQANVSAFLWLVPIPLLALFYFEETVTPEAMFQARLAHQGEPQVVGWKAAFLSPFMTLKVLGRSSLFRTLTAVTVPVQMANEASQTLLLYYVTSPPLCFSQTDLGALMVLIGASGIVTQGFLLRPLVRLMGERRVLVFSSVAGAVHTVFYALAEDKQMLVTGAGERGERRER